MPIVTISDYDSYNSNRNMRHFSRQCPNYQTMFPGLSRSCNPFVPDTPLRLRRIAFLLVYILRLLHSAFFSYHAFFFWNSFWGIIITLLNILAFFFVLWNLHLIVDMEGERKVFGITFGRGAFDAFLWAMVAAHAWVVGWDFWVGVGSGSGIWSLLFLVIYLVAWVSTWDSEDGGLSLA